jgi:hypothetical protein
MIFIYLFPIDGGVKVINTTTAEYYNVPKETR